LSQSIRQTKCYKCEQLTGQDAREISRAEELLYGLSIYETMTRKVKPEVLAHSRGLFQI